MSLPCISKSPLWCVLIATLALLGACGGGQEAAPEGREKPLSINLEGLNIPPDASTKGMWGPVKSWPLIGLHAILLPDGRVLSYGTNSVGKQTGYFIYDVWNPSLGTGPESHLTLPNQTLTDLFCSGQIVLPDASAVFLTGGDNWTGTATTNLGNTNTNLFSPADNSLTRGPEMARPRWYATATTLPNGEVYIQGGKGGADLAEVRGTNGVLRPLTGMDTTPFYWQYPRNFVAPDGNIFGFDVFGNMYTVNPTGNGALVRKSYFNLTRGEDSTAAMFRPGKILQFGGSSSAALVIDITSGTAVVTPTQSLSSQRRWVTSTVLPDGRVLATGGSRVYNDLTDVNNKAEIWNPVSGTWTLGAEAQKARLYHSIAMLLPDGSVLVGGGGAPGPQNNTNAEIYYPQYLFTAQGALAPRPVITGAPTVTDIGRTARLTISGGQAIARMTLIKTGSVTHSFNNEQRFLDLTFSVQGNQVAVQMPTRANDAPPGMYMLFAIDSAGVPSEARLLRINVASNPNPATTPTLVQPANQSGLAGLPGTLQLSASDPNGDALVYAATGLPPGLSVDASSGLISGVPQVEGNYTVVVSATDGVNSASRSFTWTINGNTPITVGLTSSVEPLMSQVGSLASFNATATGLNPTYSWSFGDGTAPSAWSSSGAASHVFAQAGSYVVTVSARDDLSRQASFSFMQSVYLPAAAGRPTSSSSIAIETRANGPRRVWVVNQDNNTVSVFDESSQARLAEIAVGTLPRHVAIAANGRIWVSNKQSATISLIDPSTLGVVGSIALPRASQPHGLAMSPDGAVAFVALEATGQVMKYDTSSLARLATANVGANPRHLAVRADGAEVLVSRFITPPQPGESTQSVGSSVGNLKTGGEVVVLNTASLALLRTTVLEHSARPDTELSGRGVPNYLGAAAISPDGTQAWVPSKQDNIMRGMQRDGLALNFQNTVRAVASRINLSTGTEDAASRIDLDNAGVASAAAFDARGVYLFVALETSRQIAVVDAHRRVELFRIETGRAPQGLAVSADGQTLYVENFMDRTLGSYDLRPLVERGQSSVPLLSLRSLVGTEKLTAQVLVGKQHFYDARDTRLARDSYLSCASCHNEAGHDGRVWDLASMGEGLRRTIGLRGKGRQKGHGFLHWSGNFDEAQDFEGQIRTLAGGTGLMSDALFSAGTTAQPLGSPKAGKSADLDALAAYLTSLSTYDNSPTYPVGTPPASYVQGQALFRSLNCAACHGGEAFSSSGAATLHNIGTLKPTSGQRLGAALPGIDPPSLRGAWAQAAYLHDGSALTLDAAVRAHQGVTVSDSDLGTLVNYLRTIGHEEVTAPEFPGTGGGLSAQYFANLNFTGPAALSRVEVPDFTWGIASPGVTLPVDGWSVRWSGSIEAPATGDYVMQVISDDGARLVVNGQVLVDKLGLSAGNVTYTAVPIYLVAGQRYSIVVEHQDRAGDSTFKLRWTPPGSPVYYVTVPASRLY